MKDKAFLPGNFKNYFGRYGPSVGEGIYLPHIGNKHHLITLLNNLESSRFIVPLSPGHLPPLDVHSVGSWLAIYLAVLFSEGRGSLSGSGDDISRRHNEYLMWNGDIT